MPRARRVDPRAPPDGRQRGALSWQHRTAGNVGTDRGALTGGGFHLEPAAETGETFGHEPQPVPLGRTRVEADAVVANIQPYRVARLGQTQTYPPGAGVAAHVGERRLGHPEQRDLALGG